MSSKRFNIGAGGETPKKQYVFSIYDAPTAIPKATPLKDDDKDSSPSNLPPAPAHVPKKSALTATSKYSLSEDIDLSADVPMPPVPPRVPSRPSKYIPTALDSPTTVTTKENTRSNAVNKSALFAMDSRPKTSRGKSCPSPDEFADYIIPSPQKGDFGSNDNLQSLVIEEESTEDLDSYESESEDEEESYEIRRRLMEDESDEDEDESDEEDDDMDDDSDMYYPEHVSYKNMADKKLMNDRLVCWLFACTLNISYEIYIYYRNIYRLVNIPLLKCIVYIHCRFIVCICCFLSVCILIFYKIIYYRYFNY